MVRRLDQKHVLDNAFFVLVLPIILTVPNFMAMSVKGTTTITSKGTNQTLYSITVETEVLTFTKLICFSGVHLLNQTIVFCTN